MILFLLKFLPAPYVGERILMLGVVLTLALIVFALIRKKSLLLYLCIGFSIVLIGKLILVLNNYFGDTLITNSVFYVENEKGQWVRK